MLGLLSRKLDFKVYERKKQKTYHPFLLDANSEREELHVSPFLSLSNFSLRKNIYGSYIYGFITSG